MTQGACDFCDLDRRADLRAVSYGARSSGFRSTCCLWRDDPGGPVYLVVDTDLWLSDREGALHLAEADESMAMAVRFCPVCGRPLGGEGA